MTAPDGKRPADLASGELDSGISNAIQKKRGSGSSLPESAQREARKALGRDFKDVRIHTDGDAHELSRAIHARAFTIGNDIFFKQGAYAPGTKAGRETLIHELTHVVQQSGNKSSGRLKLGAPDTVHEKEADRMGKGPVSAGSARSGAVQAQEEDDLIQPQEEEDLIQSQPEVSGVVQRDDDWETSPEPVKQKRPKPISKEKMSGLGSSMISEMRSGAIKQGLAPAIPKAPAPPLPKRPKAPIAPNDFKAQIASKAKSMSSNKQRQNIAKLETKRAATEGARISEQYKEDQAAKPKSFGSKVKGLAKKAGSWGLDKLKEAGKSKVNEYSKHFLGIDVFEKDKDEEEDGKKEKKGGKGGKEGKSDEGGAISTIMQEYAKVLQENKELKAKLKSSEE